MNITAKISCFALLCGTALHGQFLNEFAPNPAGTDPADTSVELTGTIGGTFDLWILAIENDGFNGLVDRVNNVTGTFDSNGLAVVSVPDFENPSFTLVLASSFTGDTSTDIDPADNGTLDLSAFGTIYDAVGVSDSAGDDTSLYGALLGGSDVFYNGNFEPLSVFRDSVSGEHYSTVTVNFGDPSEYIAVFNSAGVEVSSAIFNIDPTIETYGAINPTAVPEPSTYAALLGALALGFVAYRRRKA